jgi:predicted permease
MGFRYAVRCLVRQPMFTAGAVATLAIGIGVNSTIFTLANAALLRPMSGIADPERLVWLSPVWQGRDTGMSYPDYADYRDASGDLFDGVFGFAVAPLSVGGGAEPERVRGHLVTGSYFATLGVTPALGRLIGPGDERSGASPYAVIGHRLWIRRFSASPDVVSTPVTINGRVFEVIGVAPERFAGPALGEAADVWLSISLLPAVRASDSGLLADREAALLQAMGRLRPGMPVRRAHAVLNAVAARLDLAHPRPDGGRLLAMTSAESGLPPAGRREAVPLGALLLTIAGIVLLIACANLANLLLARGASRSVEIGIRAALGATRGRIVRQLMTESLVLGAAGAAAGLIASFWASDLLVARLPEADFRGLDPRADLRVLLFTSALGGLSVCAFGMVPALSATRGALRSRLQPAGSGGRSRLQGAFVVAQLSLSLVLLLAGGLSLRALQKAGRIDLGFNPAGVLTLSYDLALQNYSQPQRIDFRRELRRRIQELPGVRVVGVANTPPLSGIMVRTVVATADAGQEATELPVFLTGVGPGYFDSLQLPIVYGRALEERDTRGAEGAAVVNETLARRLWSSSSPLGRQLRIDDQLVRVVGVARDARYDEATEDQQLFLYTSLDQAAQLDREAVLVRTTGSPAQRLPEVREVIRTMDPALPVFDARTLEQQVRERADRQRGVSVLVGAFGAVALLLAAVGLYGVMSYAVSRRAREMGIRLALGATPAQLSALIARDAARLALAGVLAGSTLALPLASMLGALLFGPQIADVAAFGLICALLIAVALVASLVPARRAGRLDPIDALKE